MSRVRFHSIDAIARHPEVELIKSGPGWEGFNNCKQVQDKYAPDLIIWYKPLNIPGYDSITIPACLRYNEMWDINNTTEEILKSKSKIIICHHQNDIINYEHINNVIFKHNPHCAEKSIFKNYGAKKDFDIQLIGLTTSPLYYPFRTRLKDIMEKIMVPKYGINFRVLSHPGAEINDVDGQVINYAIQLNRAKINITCSSKFRYALAKYSEVPMCNSLLAADLPGENKEWYSKWMCVLDNCYSDEKIIDTLLLHINNEDLLYEKIKNGYEENIRCRSQENYANNFVNIIKAAL